MRVGLVLLASHASLYIFVYERCEARPSKFRGNKLAGFKVTWVASSFMIVAASKDGMSERGIGGNINMSLVGENAFGILPVRETRAECWRDPSIHRL